MAGAALMSEGWRGVVRWRTSTVAFIENESGGLKAVHGPEVPSFPFSYTVDGAEIQRFEVGTPVGFEAGTMKIGQATIGARPAMVPPAIANRRALPPEAVHAALAEPARGAAIADDPTLRRVRDTLFTADGHRRATMALLGRGPGLTPSGDDVLLGAYGLAARLRLAWGHASVVAQIPQTAELARERTTALSAALFAEAARGRFAAPVEAVSGAINSGSASSVAVAVADLAAVGAHSGRDMILGMKLYSEWAASPRPLGRSASGRCTEMSKLTRRSTRSELTATSSALRPSHG